MFEVYISIQAPTPHILCTGNYLNIFLFFINESCGKLFVDDTIECMYKGMWGSIFVCNKGALEFYFVKYRIFWIKEVNWTRILQLIQQTVTKWNELMVIIYAKKIDFQQIFQFDLISVIILIQFLFSSIGCRNDHSRFLLIIKVVNHQN